MAQQGSQGESLRTRQGQGPQHQPLSQVPQSSHGQGPDPAQQDRQPRGFSNAPWPVNGALAQGVQSQPQPAIPGSHRTGQGLRRGLGEFANNNTQRNVHLTVPGNTTRMGPTFSHNTLGSLNQDTHASIATEEPQQSLGFTQALAMGVSIATSKFNTERFGTLSFNPIPNATTNILSNATTNMLGATGTHLNTNAIDTQYDPDAIESLDDDLELPGDFDDDFAIVGMDINKDLHGMDTDAVMSQTGPIFGGLQPPATQIESEETDDSQTADEMAVMKQRMAEMETLLREREEELLIKSGQASIFKEKFEDESRAHSELKERHRATELQNQTERHALEEKHRKDLENANMNHLFEVQKYIMDGPPSSKSTKVTQLPRQPVTQPASPQFPKSFSGFASTQSSIKAQPRSDDVFSIPLHNFAASPKSPRKSRSYGVNNVILEKPRPFSLSSEPARTARPGFGFSTDIPTHSDEEIIRDKLLAGQDNIFGLKQLLTIKADEEQYFPLPGSQEHQKNTSLEEITRSCLFAMNDLLLDVCPRTKSEALKTTTALLQASVVMRKPLHTLNALQVLTTLYCSYEDLSKEICKGAVPFLENEREDPLKVVPSAATLPSALACIHYLFLSRVVTNATSAPATAAAATLEVAFLGTRKEYRLTEEAEDQLQADIFLLMRLIAGDQMETKVMGRTFMSLVRRRIYDEALSMHLAQRNYKTLDRILGIIDVVTKEPECARLFIGWSVSRERWGEAFSQIDTFVDLIALKTENLLDLANGVIPQLKIKVLRILDRLILLDFEQTKKIIYKTKLMNRIIYSVRSLVELAGQLQTRKAMVLSALSRTQGASSITPSPISTGVPVTPSASGTIAPKTEPFGPGSGSMNLSDLFSAPGMSTIQPPSILTTPATSAGSASGSPFSQQNQQQQHQHQRPESSFSSFLEKALDPTLYRPSVLFDDSWHRGDQARKDSIVGLVTGKGGREMSALMSPHNRIFDHLELLKVELEFLGNIFRAVGEYRRYLYEREPTEYRALAFAVSQVAVSDLGLPVQAQELAHDVLVELVADEDEEDRFLELVRDKL